MYLESLILKILFFNKEKSNLFYSQIYFDYKIQGTEPCDEYFLLSQCRFVLEL